MHVSDSVVHQISCYVTKVFINFSGFKFSEMEMSQFIDICVIYTILTTLNRTRTVHAPREVYL